MVSADARSTTDLNRLRPPAVTGVHASLRHITAAIVVIGVRVVAVVIVVVVWIEAVAYPGAECETVSEAAVESPAKTTIVESARDAAATETATSKAASVETAATKTAAVETATATHAATKATAMAASTAKAAAAMATTTSSSSATRQRHRW